MAADSPEEDQPDHDNQPDHGDHLDHDHHAGHHPGHDGDHHAHDHAHSPGLAGLVRSVFHVHSHDTSDTVASALSATDEGVRALKLSLAGLTVTAVIELAVVLASGSIGLLSDTIHNFADALTAVPLGVAFWLGRRPSTHRYTYGYGRAEDLAGVFIVATIAGSSVVAAWEAIVRLQHPRPLHGLGWVAAAGLVGFAGNEAVAWYRIRVGRQIGSAALVADGRHARTDGITSLAVVVGAIGVAAGWREADPVVGLVITSAILVILGGTGRDIYRRLMDSVDPELVDSVIRTLAAVPGVEQVEQVRLRWVGHELRAEADIASNADLTIAQGHAIAEVALHQLLHDIPRLAQATIHTNPSPAGGVDAHSVTAHHFEPRRR